jgi:hypothetical protein
MKGNMHAINAGKRAGEGWKGKREVGGWTVGTNERIDRRG